MKYKRFDVVELNNGNRATILDIKKNYYNVEIVNPYGITLDKKFISNDEIKGLICSSKRIYYVLSLVWQKIRRIKI